MFLGEITSINQFFATRRLLFFEQMCGAKRKKEIKKPNQNKTKKNKKATVLSIYITTEHLFVVKKVKDLEIRKLVVYWSVSRLPELE